VAPKIPELLTNAHLRRYVAHHPRQHDRWRQYWQEYDQRSQAEQLTMVGPVLNKLRAFTRRTSLRLILGQATGLDLGEVFTKRKVLLVPLSEGQIGAEAAALIGSLIVGALWQATLRRTVVPASVGCAPPAAACSRSTQPGPGPTFVFTARRVGGVHRCGGGRGVRTGVKTSAKRSTGVRLNVESKGLI